MKLDELFEGVAKEYDDFSEWSRAVKAMGAVTHTTTGDKQKIFATSDLKKPAVKAFGEWNEKYNRGVTYTIRRPLRKAELAL